MNQKVLVEKLRRSGASKYPPRTDPENYSERALFREAADVIEKQEQQLKEWEKYAGFLHAHGFFQEQE